MTAGVLAAARAAASAAVNATGRPSGGAHETRERLIFRSELDYELLLLFAKNELSTAVATPLLAVIVAVGAMFWAPPAQLLLWLATVFLAKGLLISLCRQFLRTPREEAGPLTWRTKMMAAEFLYGLSWAAVAFVSAGSGGEAAHTFVFAALLIVISMRMLFAAPVMPIVYAGTDKGDRSPGQSIEELGGHHLGAPRKRARFLPWRPEELPAEADQEALGEEHRGEPQQQLRRWRPEHRSDRDDDGEKRRGDSRRQLVLGEEEKELVIELGTEVEPLAGLVRAHRRSPCGVHCRRSGRTSLG